jgi:hypothetical protein
MPECLKVFKTPDPSLLDPVREASLGRAVKLWKRTDSWILLTEDVFMAELCSVGGSRLIQEQITRAGFPDQQRGA